MTDGVDREHLELVVPGPDPDIRRRNRNNKGRGTAFERFIAKRYGGRRTGPLLGKDDVVVGNFAAIQTKKTINFSMSQARQYLTDLTVAFPDHVALVIHSAPGDNRGAVVVLWEKEWFALHGPEGEKR